MNIHSYAKSFLGVELEITGSMWPFQLHEIAFETFEGQPHIKGWLDFSGLGVAVGNEADKIALPQPKKANDRPRGWIIYIYISSAKSCQV